MIKIFLQGLTMGLAYVAPIGLQNLFVINAALTHKLRRSLLTALIVVFFDITLALACFFGIGAIMQKYEWLNLLILLVGSLIVIYMGIKLLKSKVDKLDKTKSDFSISKTITSACVVTWFNPQAIIDGSMMLGAFRVSLSAAESMPFISGVAAASFLWFMFLTVFLSLFANKFNIKILQIVNTICGTIILFYGLKLLYTFVLMVTH